MVREEEMEITDEHALAWQIVQAGAGDDHRRVLHLGRCAVRSVLRPKRVLAEEGYGVAVKTAYTDGACRGGNPGFTSCAWVLYAGEDEGTFGGRYLGPERHTNNYAEYMGLILLLEHLYLHSTRNVIIHSDSELVVNQVNQSWQINQEDLRKMATKAYGLLVAGCHVLKHVKGHYECKGNIRADQICNELLDQHKEEYEKQA